jgi:hypothetical protein
MTFGAFSILQGGLETGLPTVHRELNGEEGLEVRQEVVKGTGTTRERAKVSTRI